MLFCSVMHFIELQRYPDVLHLVKRYDKRSIFKLYNKDIFYFYFIFVFHFSFISPYTRCHLSSIYLFVYFEFCIINNKRWITIYFLWIIKNLIYLFSHFWSLLCKGIDVRIVSHRWEGMPSMFSLIRDCLKCVSLQTCEDN